MSNNQLHHAGVKGMKWGVRKDRNKGTITPSKGRKKLSAMEKTGVTNTKAGRKAYGNVEDSINYSRPKKSKSKTSASSKLRSMASKTLKAATAGLNTAVAIQADVEIAKSSYKLINSVPNKDRGYVAAAIYSAEYKND